MACFFLDGCAVRPAADFRAAPALTPAGPFFVFDFLITAVDFPFAERSLRARSRSAGVSTPSGTVSTIRTSIRIPASSARSCSSFSRNSNGDGGNLTNRSSANRR